MKLEDGRVLLMNRGWVSQDYRQPEARPSTLAAGPQKSMRSSAAGAKGLFCPENDIADNHWFTLNIAEIAAHHGLADVIQTYTADVLRPKAIMCCRSVLILKSIFPIIISITPSPGTGLVWADRCLFCMASSGRKTAVPQAAKGAEMKYISTRGGDAPIGFEDALLAGLARDGGLYLPQNGRS